MAGQSDAQAPQAANGGEGATETLEGTVERIVFSNAETMYAVLAMRFPGIGMEVTVVGNLATVQPQEVLQVRGGWIVDKKYGRQFKVETYTPVLPSSGAAIEKYLGSGMIKGIGRTYAKRLVERFGPGIFDIIEQSPDRLREVDGIGEKRLGMILKGWDEHRAMREILLFCQQHSIPQGFAARIFRQYGDRAVDQIRRNPYQLALDVKGIGFKSADSIAQKIGIPVESIERCKAGVFFLLQELAGDGHCFYPADPLIERAIEALAVEQRLIVEAINALKAENHIVLEVLPDATRAVYLRGIHRHEEGVAELLSVLMRTGKLLPKIEADAEIEAFEGQFHFHLAPRQHEAVARALSGGVLVITGGPGTGKTTIIKAVLRILAKFGVTALLAAPTGRAAKRMQEMTHTPASTIHRLLQFSPQEGRYLRNAANPLRGDFIVVDEASMIDIGLAQALLRAVAATSSIVFVGDTDQLPSVGPGNFLRDLITSRAVSVVRLDEIFRQASRSRIITNAHRINRGEMPVFVSPAEEHSSDFHYVEADDPQRILEVIKRLVADRIPQQLGVQGAGEIQVITPMHRGIIGAQNLNRELQALLNPKGSALVRTGAELRVGDKVMQTANDYEKDVFNGDIGFVSGIEHADHLVRVEFEGRTVPYDFNELDDLDLAYAITVHKSQGSEYRAVVMPVHTTHFVMLQRNLLYTGITRGKAGVWLVGQRRAVSMAVDNISSSPRHSALGQRLAVLVRDA